VLDCIAERLAPQASARAHRRVRARGDRVARRLGVVGEDRAFLAAQAARGRRVIAIGDVLHERGRAPGRRAVARGRAARFRRPDVRPRSSPTSCRTVEELTIRDDTARRVASSVGASSAARTACRARATSCSPSTAITSRSRARALRDGADRLRLSVPCTFCVIDARVPDAAGRPTCSKSSTSCAPAASASCSSWTRRSACRRRAGWSCAPRSRPRRPLVDDVHASGSRRRRAARRDEARGLPHGDHGRRKRESPSCSRSTRRSTTREDVAPASRARSATGCARSARSSSDCPRRPRRRCAARSTSRSSSSSTS
jgi:hypothetical protein